jgi:hypothetical protein
VGCQYIHTRLHDVRSQKTVIFCPHHENPTYVTICILEQGYVFALSVLGGGGGAGGEPGANYWDPVVLRGVQGPIVLPVFVFLGVITICRLYK